jgi:hypothetical protein
VIKAWYLSNFNPVVTILVTLVCVNFPPWQRSDGNPVSRSWYSQKYIRGIAKMIKKFKTL